MKKFFCGIIFFTIFSFSFGKMQAVSKYQVKDVQGITISLRGNEPFTGMVADGKDREYYLKGKPHGKWVSFYSNGKIKSIENWKEGILDGKYILYNENGKKVLETHYKKGIDHGKYAVYHKNGKLCITGRIKNGVPVGKWKIYNENGKLAGMSKY